MGLALAGGAGHDVAIELALLACGVVVEKAGVATASAREMIEAELAASRAPGAEGLVSVQAMTARVEQWRAGGLKVGFTNGCFDILHPGHVAYLAQARSWCDRLIVGLNSDRSVRAAKGPSRPVNPLEARASVLAALSCVDLVVGFDEDTPLRLIEAARPDLLVKGGDYALDGVVGADLVRSWGGEVRLAAFVEGHSTTETLRRRGGRVMGEAVLVTGGAGFIGSNIVAQLVEAGRDVVVCDRLRTAAGGKWRNLAKHAIADFVAPEALFAWLESHADEVGAVVHMGAISSTREVDADLVIHTNFTLSRDLFDWCAARGKRLIYASSAAVYGDGDAGVRRRRLTSRLWRRCGR